MEYFVIFAAAFITSGLTLFSGFGLGTILLPVFVIFFPVDIAIAVTAIVHLLNNIFKLSLFGKHANKNVGLRFGIPAIIAAFLGAKVLIWFSDLPILTSYNIGNHEFEITPVKLVIAFLIMFFALFEMVPRLEKISFDRKFLPLGGVLSGFFGGLSGHQGALRSIFLLKYGLSKESFIATGVVIGLYYRCISYLCLYFTLFNCSYK